MSLNESTDDGAALTWFGELVPQAREVGYGPSMPHAYTDDQLVEQPAIGLFAELGWITVSLPRFCRTRGLLLPRLPSGQVELALESL